MRRLRTFAALTPQDQAAIICAWVYLVAARLGLSFMGMARSLQWLVPADAPTATESYDDPAKWPRAALWLPLAARYCPGAKCLPRSIALLALLRRAGIACELRIGIGKTAPGLEAHAWVEVNGQPVNDALDVAQRYRAFQSAFAAS